MSGLQRRRPLQTRHVWSATENRNGRRDGGLNRQTREQATARAGGRCQAGIEDVCTGRGWHVHHLLRRGQGGPDELDNLALLCGECHGYVHERVEWSYRVGLLRRRRDPGPFPWTPDDYDTAWAAWQVRGAP